MYQRPDMITPGQAQPIVPRKMQAHFDDFYQDLFDELSKYGHIDTLADHMVGNVYVQFREEEHAANALRNLTGIFYAGRPIIMSSAVDELLFEFSSLSAPSWWTKQAQA